MTVLAEQFAPDVYVYKPDGTRVALQTYWSNRILVLTFLRHFGCVFCREFISNLRAAYPDFVLRGAGVIAIAQGTAPQVAHFANVFRIPFPVFADPNREAYQAFGLTECGYTTMLNSSVMRETMAAQKRGYSAGLGHSLQAAFSINGSSLRQMGGTFIVNQQGRILYTHIAKQVYEHVAIDELLAVLDSLAQPDPAI